MGDKSKGHPTLIDLLERRQKAEARMAALVVSIAAIIVSAMHLFGS